jgi:peptidoglycan/LPS O-acetylase OafA/YrhL
MFFEGGRGISLGCNFRRLHAALKDGLSRLSLELGGAGLNCDNEVMKQPSRAATVDLSLILRGLMACAVVWWHAEGNRPDQPLPDFLNVPGRVAVWVFFGLSGYVIAHRLLRSADLVREAPGFYLRRAARVFPLFWAGIIVVLLLVPSIAAQYDPARVLSSLLAVQWLHTNYPVGVFWTLGIELQFYLFSPLIVAFILWARAWWAVGLGWLLLWLAFGHLVDDRSTLGNLQHFIAGMFVARLSMLNAGQKLLSLPWLPPAAGLLGIVALSLSAEWYGAGNYFILSLVVDIAVASLLLLHVSVERRAIPAGAIAKALMVLGTIAYGIYAWHGVLMAVVPTIVDQVALLFLLSLGFAAASYVVFERPLLDWAKSRRWTVPLAP